MTTPTRSDIRSGLGRLSSLSPAVQELLPRIGDDTSDVNELGRILSKDPLLVARVLRLANSPFYGLPKQVHSLQEAMVILGFSNLRSVVLSAGVIAAFSDQVAIARSLATAAAARSLAKSLKMNPGMACTAGLLHNLGGLLLGHFAPEAWQALDSQPMDSVEARLQQERALFGFDHCELGSDIAADWRFPEDIRTAIRLHANPPDNPGLKLVDVIHAAWALSAPDGDTPPAIAPGVFARLGLDQPEGSAALESAIEAARESQNAL